MAIKDRLSNLVKVKSDGRFFSNQSISFSLQPALITMKNFSSAIPTKVFEYIAAGRNILLGLPEGAAKEIFQNFKGVEIFEVGNQTNFNNAFIKLKNSSLTLQDKEFNQLYLKENFIREKTMQNLTNKLCNILTD